MCYEYPPRPGAMPEIFAARLRDLAERRKKLAAEILALLE
jgi:hypothetical protein